MYLYKCKSCLLQHAHKPVNRFPWTEEAFTKAKKKTKPSSYYRLLYLFIDEMFV
ncbi:DUF255 domain-containing protein [Paenibacillus sp. N5-1-1-5]|uniref:DUF255 domain-containing protein n=1 Tax=Paenibacillus radicis (ex Xue et al. 2023) TaxID=2972489 RepID=A0ABT1YQF2_9BACL|nr:DUF255 domain-containing protein [Paenibacillus radicis (ex Xue et al. 2023)]